MPAPHDLDPVAMTDEERRAKRRYHAGFVFETMPAPTDPIAPPARSTERCYTDPDCDFCQKYRTSPYSMCPPHDASTRCQSGSRTHCSCDACF